MRRIAEPCQIEENIKKSRFITYLEPVHSEDEAKLKLAEIRKLHPKATHCCSAYRIDPLTRSNDDGEPSSTAGLPMLEVLLAHELDHVLAVVVRYFGGTLLGKGGLIRAYSGGVKLAIESASLLEAQRVRQWEVSVPLNLMQLIEGGLKGKAEIAGRRFDHVAHYDLIVWDESLEAELIDASSGRIQISPGDYSERWHPL